MGMALTSPLSPSCSPSPAFPIPDRFWGGACGRFLRSSGGPSWHGKKKMKHEGSLPSAMASPSLCCQITSPSPSPDASLEVVKLAREKFAKEISFRSRDEDISVAKALLYVAAEDEAFMAFNRDKDACSVMNERKDSDGVTIPLKGRCDVASARVGEFCMAGKSISAWLNEFDVIAKEVEAELVTREIGCHLVSVLEAVNDVLFESRRFKRFPLLMDSSFSYLHTVLCTGCGSAIMLSIIYIEICRRLGVTVFGSPVGEDFLIWPLTHNPEELFKVSSGHSLLAIINGGCMEDPRSKASDLTSKSLSGLDIATNRDIIGIALANLIRFYWKRASKGNHGLMLTSPLRPVFPQNDKRDCMMNRKLHVPQLRPLELRLASMASERLLLLQPDNWALRRDYGMLLYYDRRYGEAVQELSICMAFAPVEEAEVLQPFVDKLHLMLGLMMSSCWQSLPHSHPSSAPLP